MTEEAILAEYKALRDEAMVFYTRRATVQNLATILFVGFQTAAFLQRIPELSIAATLIMVAFWSDEIRWIEMGAKIGAYIRVVLEPRVAGLHWETIIQKAHDPTRQTPTFISRLLLLFSRYPMTVLVGIGLGLVSLFFCADTVSVPRLFLGAFVIILSLLWGIRLFWVGTNHGRMHRRWEEIFAEVIREEQSEHSGHTVTSK